MAERFSSHDMLAMVAELNAHRIKTVIGRAMRSKGGEMAFTDEQLGWLRVARELHQRYKRHRYHHTDEELSSVLALARWLVHLHRESQGFPDKAVEFRGEAMSTARPVRRGTYDELLTRAYIA